MKRLNGFIVLFILCLTFTGCMPESLTKFREDAVKKDAATSASSFTDDSGNVVDSSFFNEPTSLSFDDQSFVVNETVTIFPEGSLGDLKNLSEDTTMTTEDGTTISYDTIIENYDPVFSISPALPSGLTFNTETGVIAGTPSNITASQTHTLTLQFTDPDDLTTTTLTTTFNSSVQEDIDESFRVTFGSSATSQTMFLTVDDIDGFTEGESVSAKRTASETAATGTITFVDEDTLTLVIDVSSGEFKIGDVIDDKSSYVATEATVEGLGYYFESSAGSTDNVHLVAASDADDNLDNTLNSTQFSIEPDLPTGLNFDTTTGEITGVVSSAVEGTSYTIKAYNDIDPDGVEFSFTLSIVDPPTLLSYNQSVVFEVEDASAISVGDLVSTNIQAPLTEGANGEVRYISNNYIVVNVFSGTFAQDQSLDINDEYIDEDTTIESEPYAANTVLILDSLANLSKYSDTESQSALCLSGTAAGVITEMDSAANAVFIAQTKSATFPGEFSEGDTLVNSSTCGSDFSGTATPTISSVWSSAVDITIGSVGLTKGEDVTVTALSAAGYISAHDGANDITIELSTQSPFVTGNNIVGSITGDSVSISSVSTNLKFSVTRGEEVLITPFATKGIDAFYSVDPTLPDGLVLDSTSGEISGTPEEATNNTEYTVTAKNSVGTYETIFNMQVYDYFQIYDESETSSYVLHKSGELNKTRRCRINKEDIDDFQAGGLTDPTLASILDVECFLDAEETDLYTLGAKFTIDAGPDVCEFVEYKPYSFFSHRPAVSDVTTPEFALISGSCEDTSVASGDIFHIGYHSGLPTSDAISATGASIDAWGTPLDMTQNEMCNAYYARDEISCDSGEIKYRLISIVTNEDGVDCDYTITTETLDCGGQISACVQGPAKGHFSDDEIDNGITTTRTSSSDGAVISYDLNAPIDQGFNTNITLANFAASNSCSNGTYEVTSNGWRTYSQQGTLSTLEDVSAPQMARQPYYTAHCTDSAGEIKARIRLVIRDWDKNFSKSNNIDQILETTYMDNSGTDQFGNNTNNYSDWESFRYGGAATLTGCDDSTAPSSSTDDPGVNVDVYQNSTLVVYNSGNDFNNLTEGMTVEIDGGEYTIRRILDGNFLLLANPVTSADNTNTALTISGHYYFPLESY